MKVLHVDTGMTWRGGQQQVFYLHRGLLQSGVESMLICSKGGELERRAGGAGLAPVGLPLRGEWDVGSAAKIAQLIMGEGVTHLHAHSSHAQMLALVASKLSKVDHLISTRRVDFIPKRHLFNRYKYGSSFSRFISISRAISSILVEFGVAPERIAVVPSGVDTEKVTAGSGRTFRWEMGVEEGQPLVGNIAHLADHKGQKYFIQAMPAILARRPDARFVIVGEGELEKELKNLAADLNLGDKLVFTGFRKDVEPIMDGLDLFVMPSHMEGLGTIVIDALAAKKPVVGTRAGGIPDIIEHEQHGVLVKPRDPEGLAEGVVRLLNDPLLAAMLADRGRRRVVEKFSVEAMVKGNLEVYRELAG